MKKTILIVLVLLFSTTYLLAQIPQTISWQGILQDGSGNPLNGNYNLTVKLFDVASGGTALWSETHSSVVIADGLVNLNLGSVTPFSINFADEYWLEITVGIGTPLPRIKLSSVPYALHSKTAESVNETDPTWSGTANETANIGRTGNVGIGTSSPSALLHTHGSGTGEGNVLHEGVFKISNPGEPPASGEGTRMMWYPDKGAFRVGGVSGTDWDKDSIGEYSVAMGYNTKAKGWISMALGEGTTASEWASTAMGYNTTASGLSSTAMGQRTTASDWYATAMGMVTTASGLASTAMGGYTIASGQNSTAMGDNTIASGGNSTAMGSYTTASGGNSTAMGYGTSAKSFSETVIGNWNTDYTPVSALEWNANDRLFVVGNGIAGDSRRDALTVLKNGYIGIGTSTPSALLHTHGHGQGEGNVLLEGVYKTSNPGDPPASGEGTRMMWYPDKAAFRVGGVSGTQWDKDSIGIYSTAMGSSTTASGSRSTAMGFITTASGWYSTAMGSSTTASGQNSTAMGKSTTASGLYSTAMGSSTTASAESSTAMGDGTTASGLYSTAMGSGTTASGNYSTAMGFITTASGTTSTAMGGGTTASGHRSTAMGSGTTASGNYSTAMGHGTIAKSAFETAVGGWNTDYEPSSITSWNANDRLFVIGNGTAGDSRRDALTVLKNGHIGIGTSTPSALLHTIGQGQGEGNVLHEGEYKVYDPGDPPASGAGTRMMWYPDKAAFRAGSVTGTQWDKDSIGIYSIAMGYNSKAKGANSIAIGQNTTASGLFSTAIGYWANASGTVSTALGANNSASGYASTAMGERTSAKSAFETVVGRWNLDYTPVSATEWNANDRLFVIGNGTALASQSNAMTVLKSGNTGIGTSTPTALLHTSGTGTGGGNVLFVGEYKSTANQGSPPVTGAGTRMMWYPDKGAFRAGRVTSTEWDKDSIGDYSVAFGYSAIAKSLSAVAIGAGNIANAPNSTALGAYTTASGKYSTAIGYQLNAKSISTTAIGQYNVGFGDSQNWYSTDPIFEIGIGINESNKANAMTVLKNGNIGIGTINPAGNRLRVVSNASGGTNSTGYFENTNGSGLALRATTNSSDGTILSIQEGSGYTLRCDGYDPNWFVAMIVKGRQVGINTSSPTQNLDVNGNARFRSIASDAYHGVLNRKSDGTLTTATSDIRFKENVETLENSLEKVLKLRGVSFTWKNNPEYGTRIGFIAQEFEKVVPELAFTNPTDGYMGINYAEMTAVLAEAIKEQHTIIDEQNNKIHIQQTEIDELKRKLEQLLQQFSEIQNK